MRIIVLILFIICSLNVLAQGPYAPDASTSGTTAIHKDSTIFVDWASGCVVTRGWQNIADNTLGKTSVGTATSATGKSGLNGVVSLGDSGFAILTFNSPIINGAGYDFAVFENAFNTTFLELAFVEVSSDGVNFYRFNSISLSQDTVQIDNVVNTTYIHNLAGKYRAQYGTPFDLEELNGTIGLDINNITHVKIIDVVGSINPNFASFDSQENIINEPFPTPFASGGFDLDAVGVMHSIVGVEEREIAFKMYPNPTNTIVTINFSNSFEKQIEISSLSGKLMDKLMTSDSKIVINVSLYSKGIYFIKTVIGDRVGVQKLLVN